MTGNVSYPIVVFIVYATMSIETAMKVTAHQRRKDSLWRRLPPASVQDAAHQMYQVSAFAPTAG